MSNIKKLEEFYINNFNDLCNQLSHQFPSYHDGEDVVQEAFTRCIKYIDTFNPHTGSFEHWFRRVLQNVIKDKKKDLRDGGIVREEETTPQYVCQKTIDTSEATMISEAAIKKLSVGSPKSAEMLTLHLSKGYTLKDVSNIVGVSLSYAKKVLSSFKKAFQ